MWHIIEHSLLHVLEHNWLLIPVLFLTYLAMEYLEHRAGEKTNNLVRKAGRLGPLVGSVLGVVPQCGFSAAASNFYAGRVISLGTLIAVYLSTSDEMLPILLGNNEVEMWKILLILGCKVLIGIIAGFLIDFLLRKRPEEHEHIHEICEHEHCHCERSIVRSAIKHTLQITVFILVIAFALEVVLQLVGEDKLEVLILNRPVIGPLISGIVGLIPNCAPSVVITTLYTQEVIGFGALMSGLLVNAGVGVLILFRVNHDRKENVKILGLLFGIGTVAGILLDLLFS